MRTFRCILVVSLLLSLSVKVFAQGQNNEEGINIGKLKINLNSVFVAIHDESQRAAMGRERQIKPSYINVELSGNLNDNISFSLTINPVKDQMIPRPFIPTPEDRRTYFFPNQPDYPRTRGVSSDPEGLYKVDMYKHPGTDPILQQGMLREGYVDLHSRNLGYGLKVGRFYLSQGLMLDELMWFTSKDLTRIQLVNAQADNGVNLYVNWKFFKGQISVITGNGNPYHDYGYFDFTDGVEDKNSAIGVIGSVSFDFKEKFTGGVSFRKNKLNSRIEDSITLQLSKHTDDAWVLFGVLKPFEDLKIYGEYAKYTWGMAPSSAELLPGPKVKSPVEKPGYYIGIDAYLPYKRFGKWGATWLREEILRDDALVAWADANDLLNVSSGKKERTNILKIHAQYKYITAFFFVNILSNPFPELSAIKPISGMDVNKNPSNNKVGLGLRFSF